MKRTFAALLALLLTLAGCGSQPAADGRTVLRLDADGSAVLSDAVRLFNAASADYRVVMDTEAPDIVAGGAGYESSNLVDIIPYVDSGMGREDILPFLLDGLEEDGALYALPVRWGGMSYGCSKELLDGRLTQGGEQLEALGEQLRHLEAAALATNGSLNELGGSAAKRGEQLGAIGADVARANEALDAALRETREAAKKLDAAMTGARERLESAEAATITNCYEIAQMKRRL